MCAHACVRKLVRVKKKELESLLINENILLCILLCVSVRVCVKMSGRKREIERKREREKKRARDKEREGGGREKIYHR